MKLNGCIAQYQNDSPKIKPTCFGAEITLEVATVSLDELRKLMSKELIIEIKEANVG